jgi:hypothetical protein
MLSSPDVETIFAAVVTCLGFRMQTSIFPVCCFFFSDAFCIATQSLPLFLIGSLELLRMQEMKIDTSNSDYVHGGWERRQSVLNATATDAKCESF